MAAAVAAVATTVANWVAGAVATGLTAVGVSASTAVGVAAFAAKAAYVLTTVAAYAAFAVASRPDLPSPERGKTAYKAPVPPRQSGYGRVRLSGPYMLYEASGNTAYDVIALHDGKISQVHQVYLNDDPVVLGEGGFVPNDLFPDGRYGGDHITFETRLGLPTETAYADVVEGLPGIWTEDHRGDGIASIKLVCTSGNPKYHLKYYPNGLPVPSVVADLQAAYDPREAGHDPDDETTWAWSDNPALCLMHYMTHPERGMGLDYARRFLPAVDSWSGAADVNDEAVALKAGGTEKRYRCGGLYQHANHPADVILTLLSTMDGWMSQRPDGAFVLRSGKYEAPTVTFTAEHVVDYSFQRFVPDEDAVNELVVTFNSPAHDYTEVEADPWRDEADIAARGRVRSQQLPMTWVQSHAQARRLAKRQMSRFQAAVRGQVRTNLYGLNGLGERYLRLQIPEITVLADVVVEVVKVEIDLASLSVVFDWIAADPAIDAWDPATEEGTDPGAKERAVSDAIPVPVVTAVQLVAGPQVRVFMQRVRDDLTVAVRWRAYGETNWTETSPKAPDSVSLISAIHSGVVPGGTTVEVQVAAVNGTGVYSEWSASKSIATGAGHGAGGGGGSSGGGAGGGLVRQPSFLKPVLEGA